MDYKKKYLKYKLKYENLIGGADRPIEEQSSYYQEEKQSNYQYFEGIMYIIGRKLSNLLIGISNHISYIFFFKNY